MREFGRRFFSIMRIPLILLLSFGFSVFLISQRIAIVESGDRIILMREQISILKSQNDDLEIQINEIIQKENLEPLAEQEFGLRKAKFAEVVCLAEPESENRNEEKNGFSKFGIVIDRTWNSIVSAIFKNNDVELKSSL